MPEYFKLDSVKKKRKRNNNPEIWYSRIITNESTFPLIILWSPFQRWLKLFFPRCGYRFNANLVFLVVFITAIKSGSLADFVWHEGFHQAKWFSPSGNVKFRKNIINYIRQVSIIHHAHILKSLGGPILKQKLSFSSCLPHYTVAARACRYKSLYDYCFLCKT